MRIGLQKHTLQVKRLLFSTLALVGFVILCQRPTGKCDPRNGGGHHVQVFGHP